jgi:hypothetical protein
MKRVSALLFCAFMVVPLTGCVVYAHPDRPYPNAYWVPAHYGPYGGWHQGHWQ